MLDFRTSCFNVVLNVTSITSLQRKNLLNPQFNLINMKSKLPPINISTKYKYQMSIGLDVMKY